MQVDKTMVALFATILLSQAILFCLKVFNIVKWGWGWILAPLWIPYAMFIAGGSAIAVYLILYNIKERILKNKNGR